MLAANRNQLPALANWTLFGPEIPATKLTRLKARINNTPGQSMPSL